MGIFHDNGKLEGTLNGNKLTCIWKEAPTYQPNHDAGDCFFLFLHVMQRDLMDTGDMDLIQADGMVIGMGKRLSNTILYCPPGGGWLLIP